MRKPFWRGFELGLYQAHSLLSAPMFVVSWLIGWKPGMGGAIIAGVFGTYAWRTVYGFKWRVPTD